MKTMENAVEAAMLWAKNLDERFSPFTTELYVVGSCAISGEGKDIDLMIRVLDCGDHDSFTAEVLSYLVGAGAIQQPGREEYGEGDFISLRLGDINFLVVWENEVANGWLASVEICKYIGVKTREERVAIHKIVMDKDPAWLHKPGIVLHGKMGPY